MLFPKKVNFVNYLNCSEFPTAFGDEYFQAVA